MNERFFVQHSANNTCFAMCCKIPTAADNNNIERAG